MTRRLAPLTVGTVGIAVVLLQAGCARRECGVRMWLTENGSVHREVTVAEMGMFGVSRGAKSKPGHPVIGGDSATLKGIYGAPTFFGAPYRTYSGDFAGQLPADLRRGGFNGKPNHASYGRSASPLGWNAAYIERAPGLGGVTDIVRSTRQFADTWTRVMIGWAQAQESLQADPPRLEAIVRFFDTEFRTDLENLTLLLWLTPESLRDNTNANSGSAERASQPSGSAAMEARARATDYLIERGYIEPQEELRLPPVFGWTPPAGREFCARALVKKLRRECILDAQGELPAAFEALLGEDGFPQAIKIGCESAGVSQDTLLPLDWIPFVFGTKTDQVGIVWRTKTRPRLTNGLWDEKKGEVRWVVESSGWLTLPRVAYAHWYEENREYQERHFGRVPISFDLPLYNSWYESLNAEQRARWDVFIESLEPGFELKSRLKAFRFGDTAAASDDDEPEGDPVFGARMILRNLGILQN